MAGWSDFPDRGCGFFGWSLPSERRRGREGEGQRRECIRAYGPFSAREAWEVLRRGVSGPSAGLPGTRWPPRRNRDGRGRRPGRWPGAWGQPPFSVGGVQPAEAASAAAAPPSERTSAKTRWRTSSALSGGSLRLVTQAANSCGLTGKRQAGVPVSSAAGSSAAGSARAGSPRGDSAAAGTGGAVVSASAIASRSTVLLS